MAIEIDNGLLLVDAAPVCHVPANVSINHLQLRNLLLCPDDTLMPTLYTTHQKSILQHRISRPERPREELSDNNDIPGPTVTVSEIAKLPFDPVCIAFARVPSSSPTHQHTLLAAGGQSAELHISLHSANFEQRLWEYHLHIKKASINNSVLVLPPPSQPKGFASRSAPRHQTMRVLVSNNDRTVKFYEVDIGRLGAGVLGPVSGKRGDIRELGSPILSSPRSRRRNSDAPQSPFRSSPYSPGDIFSPTDSPVTEVGDLVRRYAEIKLDSAVNFTSATRDMSTLLSITDSQTIYLHNISNPRPSLLKTLSLPTLTAQPSTYTPSNLTSISEEVRELMTMHPFLVETGPHASFAAHWSADGTKFGIASQSGVVSIWDVRSDKPLWSYQTAFRLDSSNSGALGTGGNPTTPPTETASAPATSRTPTTSSMTGVFLENFLTLNMADLPLDRLSRGGEFSIGDSSLLSRLFDQWRVGTPVGRMKHAPPYGVRCLKFGRGAASDLVAFTEHTRRVHILDTRRFECHQILEIPTGAPEGQLRMESGPDNAPGTPTERTPTRPRPRRQSSVFLDSQSPRAVEPLPPIRNPSPNERQTRVNQVIENIRARLSANLAEEFGNQLVAAELVEAATGEQRTSEQLREEDRGGEEEQDMPATTVRLEDVTLSLTDVGDGVLHISSHSDEDDGDDRMDENMSMPSIRPVVWRTVGTRATSPPSSGQGSTSGGGGGGGRNPRRYPSNSVIYLHRNVSQEGGVVPDPGSTIGTGNMSPTGARLTRRPHIRSPISPTTPAVSTQLTPEDEAGDIAGLAWSASGESLFVATTKGIVEWRVSDFGKARIELGGGGDEWCEEGEEMGGAQEMVWW